MLVLRHVLLLCCFLAVGGYTFKPCPLQPTMETESCLTPKDLESVIQIMGIEGSDDISHMDQDEEDEDEGQPTSPNAPNQEFGVDGAINGDHPSSLEWTPSEPVKVKIVGDDTFVDHGTACLSNVDRTSDILKCHNGLWVIYKPAGTPKEGASIDESPPQVRTKRNVRVKRWGWGWSWGWSWFWGWHRRRCYRRCWGSWWRRRCRWVCVPAPNRPPNVYCPAIPNFRADKYRTDTFVHWSPATAHDPEDGYIGTYQTCGPRPYTRIPEGHYRVTYKATDRRGSSRTCTRYFQVYVTRCQSDHLNHPSNGKVSCSHSNRYGSVCTYTCDSGHDLIGSSKSECRSDARWTVSKPTCQAVPCTDPPSVDHSIWQGCDSPMLGNKCTLVCHAGYNVQGAPSITCQSRTSWSSPGSCRDVQAPSFTCPASITTFSAPREQPVAVPWTTPTAIDNSGETITVTSSHTSGSMFDKGDTQVAFQARDSAGNIEQCTMTVSVIVKRCEALSPPEHGSVNHCSHGRSVGSTCDITCHTGFNLIGVSQRECLDDQTWSQAQPQCERVSCGAVPSVVDGSFRCPDNNVLYEAVCTLQCSSGYSTNGHSTIACTSSATWTTPGSCVDTEKPKFVLGCPDQTIEAAKLGVETLGNYDLPQAQDNSHGTVSVVGSPPRGDPFPLGTTPVLVTATDQAGNINTCTMNVIVERGECPAPENTDLSAGEDNRLEYDCPDEPDEHVYGATCPLSCSDNNPVQGGTTSITCEKTSTGYSWYYGNTKPFCEVRTCAKIEEPEFGAIACTTTLDHQICSLFCHENYSYPKVTGQDSGVFYCGASGQWSPIHPTSNICKRGRYADTANLMPDMLYAYSGQCNQDHTEIKEKFIKTINETSVLRDKCDVSVVSCTLESVVVTCGARSKRQAERFKRSTGNNVLTVSFTVAMTPNDPSQTTKLSIEKVSDDINNALYDKAIAGELDLPDTNTSTDHNSYGMGTVTYHCSGNTLPRPNGGKYPVCLGCGPGRVYVSATEPCAKCPVGTYQPDEESSQCISCPTNTTTKYSGSTGVSDCLALCPSGSYSMTGRRPNCDLCDRGTYQSGTGKAGCDKCHYGMSTQHRGATSKDECKFVDVVFTNKTTASPTFPASTTFTIMGFGCIPSDLDDTLTTFHLTRPDATAASFGCGNLSIYIKQTSNDGRRNKRLCHHVAMTYQSPQGLQQLYVNGVLTETFTGAGLCSETRLTFVPGDQGLSEFRVNALQMAPKVLTATEIERYANSCDLLLPDNVLTSEEPVHSSTTFSTCDAPDDCTDSSCGDHGTCVDQKDGFSCECDDLWSGATCQIPPDYCKDNDCMNGATCVNHPNEGKYNCSCTSDFRGPLCGEEIVHGGWSDFDDWSPCTAKCNTGTRYRRRTCTNPPPDPDGKPCDGSSEEVDSACNPHPCPIHGVFSPWSSWLCSVTCENGTEHRSRSCDNPAPQHGGKDCDGSRDEYRKCELNPCPVNGNYTDWSDWSQCSVTCGGGVSQRERTCTNPSPEHGGLSCIEQKLGPAIETKECNTEECPTCPYLRRNSGQVNRCETNTTTGMQECTASCTRQGYVVGDTLYTCGINTNYTWDPTDRPAQCKKAEVPVKRSFAVSVTMNNTNNEEAVRYAIQDKAQTNVNVTSNAKISTSVVSTGSSGSTKKRSSGSTYTVTVSVDSPSTSTDLATASKSELDEQMSVSNDFEDSAQALAQNVARVFDVIVNGLRYVADESSITDVVSFVCNIGTEALSGLCVECGPGTYWTNNLCESCPENQYQDGFRQMKCKPCPDGTTTAGLGAQSEDECEGTRIPRGSSGGGSGNDIIIAVPVTLAILVLILVVGFFVWYKFIRTPGKTSVLCSGSQAANAHALSRPSSAWSTTSSTNTRSRPTTAVTIRSVLILPEPLPSAAAIGPKTEPPTYAEAIKTGFRPSPPTAPLPEQIGVDVAESSA